jgi:outer membrane protein insertion porin family
MVINIDKNDRVKIDDINITGNEVFSDAKVRRQMNKTKEKRFYRFWKRSKFIRSEYEADKQEIIKKYKEKGYRDARIVSDSLIKKDENSIVLDIELEEGDKYYFGDFTFLGNSVYSDELLNRILRIEKGDVYNATLLQKRIADMENPEANDITNLYKNNGYLFSRINVVETNVQNDTIDFEIRIFEGKIAYFDHIEVKGNDRTNDHVIYRSIYARPGQRYSKAAILRTQRELAQLGFFDPKSLIPEFKNVDPSTGNVDLEYNVLETGSSQVQLQGGYGGGGFVGTLGLAFNNFSLKGIFDKDAWHPFPMGDGQTLSLQAQASSYYQTYRISFSEPWLGGRRPVRLTTSFSHSIQSFYNFREREADDSRKFTITGGSVGIAKRLRVPDDYFTLSGALSFRHYDLKNYNIGLFTFPNGYSNNFAITVGLVRDDSGIDPIYPTQGSRFGIIAKFTPPYSVWNGVDYEALQTQRDVAIQNQDAETLGEIDQKRFNWLEYYKLKFEGDWYNTIVGKKLVLRSAVEFGFLGAYNQNRGIPPFERFYMGGDGLGGYALDSRENIQLRGYPNQSITPRNRTLMSEETINDGATIYNKYVLELRYPIILKPQTKIYMLGFLEGGATFDDFKDFDPFQLNRSAGLGLRLFLPQIGLLGIDFGYGFDPIPGTGGEANGWETHFIIGQQF